MCHLIEEIDEEIYSVLLRFHYFSILFSSFPLEKSIRGELRKMSSHLLIEKKNLKSLIKLFINFFLVTAVKLLTIEKFDNNLFSNYFPCTKCFHHIIFYTEKPCILCKQHHFLSMNFTVVHDCR